MDYTQLILTILTVAILGVGGSSLIYLFKSGKIAKEDTANSLYTVDQVLSVLYIIAKAVSDDDTIVEIVYNVLDGIVDFGIELSALGTLDRQLLLATAYEQCELLGVEVTKDIETAVSSGVELIYIFVSE